MDDTDSLGGGCTTEVLFRLLQQLPEQVTTGTKRLVRLWPFARRRTRGNAAVAVELNVKNEQVLLEFLEQFWDREILPHKGNKHESNHSEREQFPADPGMVWFSEIKRNEQLYKSGLRRELTLKDLPVSTKAWGGYGKIGATLAVVWPANDVTYEAIAWRTKKNAEIRKVDNHAREVVESMDETFLCRDERLGKSMLAPRGASPVLFGIRAWSKKAAKQALQVLVDAPNTESVAGSMIFETNQATNDHLDDSMTIEVESIEVLRGGHTVLQSQNDRFLAFKESGELARICQCLRPGDIIECKGLRAPDHSIHIEFLKINHLVAERTRPKCPHCNKALSSMGRNQGLRCKKCGLKQEDSWKQNQRDLPLNTWIQPPPSARRHLAKPLLEDSIRQNNL